MHKSKRRYTDAMLCSMGLQPECNAETYIQPSDKPSLNALACKGFENVINVLFSSTNGALDYNAYTNVTMDSPEIVKRFASAVLLQNIPAMRAAPDDETAFDLLIPRHAQSHSELAPYIDKLRGYVESARQSAQEATQVSE